MRELITKWTNFGDVNPIEHGGIWVKNDRDDVNIFWIIKNVNLEFINKTQQLWDLYVDVTDTWMERKAIMDFIGMREEDYDPLWYAIGATDYYSAENFGGQVTECNNEAELIAELSKYDIIVEEESA